MTDPRCKKVAGGCVDCAHQPFKPPTPGHLDHNVVLGWTSGANSITELDGNLHATWTLPAVVGVVIGLRPVAGGRAQPINPALVTHGWYHYSQAGVCRAQPMERGQRVGSALTYAPDDAGGGDVLEVRRVGTRVSYLFNGAEHHASTVPSTGAQFLNACLYSSGDSIPGVTDDTPTVPSIVTLALGETSEPFTLGPFADAASYDAAQWEDQPTFKAVVGAGATSLTFVLANPPAVPRPEGIPEDGLFSAVGLVANLGSPPVGGIAYGSANYLDISTLSGNERGNGPDALTLTLNNPAAGTWYASVVDWMYDPDGGPTSTSATLTATVTT
ncbi:MAG TPA: hypothetical protein VFG73_02290 [Rhodanobacteraceae bacterium]|nr:hypothetical protein [Rhodanobacteraceae bacterium]